MWRQVDTTLKCKQLSLESSIEVLGVIESIEPMLERCRWFSKQCVVLPRHLGAYSDRADEIEVLLVTVIGANESTAKAKAETPTAGVPVPGCWFLTNSPGEKRTYCASSPEPSQKIGSIDRNITTL